MHPVFIYFHSTDKTLKHISLRILSDDVDHDTRFVHEIQSQLTASFREKLPNVCKVRYFTDGCATQKNQTECICKRCKGNRFLYVATTMASVGLVWQLKLTRNATKCTLILCTPMV